MTVPFSALPRLRPEAVGAGVDALCGIGNRFVGSDGERRAREWILGQFRDAGLANVRVEEFPVLGYRGESSSIEVLGEGLSFRTTGLQFSASATVEAEAVYLGSPPTPDDIGWLESRGVSIAGKIVVVHAYWPFAFARELAGRGAAGFVVACDVPEGKIPNSTGLIYPVPEPSGFAGWPLDVPGVSIEVSDLHRLLALMSVKTRRLRIEHRASYASTPTGNVVGEIPGREAPGEHVVIGAHYDTQLEGVGACDNAAGVSSVIEIARGWSSLPLRRTVVLCAFADEEHGFWGSVDYCRRHRDRLTSTVGMVCLDALAWLYPAKRNLHADPSIRDFAYESAVAAGWVPEEELEANLLPASDHNPFIDAGVPACWFWRYPPQHPFYHAPGDTPELLDLDLVAGTATAAAFTAFRLAQEPKVDLGRSRPSLRRLDLRP